MPEVEGEEWKTSFYKIGKRDREPGGFQPKYVCHWSISFRIYED